MVRLLGVLVWNNRLKSLILQQKYDFYNGYTS